MLTRWLATELLRQGKVDEGVAEYHQARKLGIDNPNVAWSAAQALARAGRMPEAAEATRFAATLDPANASGVGIAMMATLQASDAEQAVEFLRTMSDKVPEKDRSWLRAMLAQALVYNGDTAGARRTLEDWPVSEKAARAWNDRAWDWLYLGEWDRAIADARTAAQLSQKPGWTPAPAMAYALSGRFAQAEEELVGRPVEDELDTTELATLAYALAAQGRTAEAQMRLKMVAPALARYQISPEPLYLSGLAYRELGDTAKSNALFERAIKRWPKHPWSEKMRELMKQG